MLYDLQEALLEERKRLEAAVQKEMKGKGPVDSSAASAGMESADAAAEAQEDALDAFMSDVQHQIEEDKVLHHEHPPRHSVHVGEHVYTVGFRCCSRFQQGGRSLGSLDGPGRCAGRLHEQGAAPTSRGLCFLQHSVRASGLLHTSVLSCAFLNNERLARGVWQHLQAVVGYGPSMIDAMGIVCHSKKHWTGDLGPVLLQVFALQKEIADIDKQVAEAERMLKFADPGER